MRTAGIALVLLLVICAQTCNAQAPATPACTVFVDCNNSDLPRLAPELTGIRFATNQDQLDALLHTTGENLSAMFAKFATVSAADEIHEMRFESGMTGKDRRENFRYVAGYPPAGDSPLEEFRTDPNYSPIHPQAKTDYLVFGHFIDLLTYLLPQNQPASRFRYLGRQNMRGRDAFVVALAQKPGESSLQSHIEAGPNGQSAPLQGLVWIDAATNRILRLRLDLLGTLPGLPLQSFTVDIALDAVSFDSSDRILWLPARVTVHARYPGVDLHSIDRFSDYRRFPAGGVGDVAPDPGTEDAWELLARGIALTAQNKPAEAVPVLRQALQLDPNIAVAHFHLANALRGTGDNNGAGTELREAAKEAPDSGPVHNFLAIVLYKRGDISGAVAEFRASVALQPKDAVAHYNLAQALEKEGSAKDALAEYRTASELAPDNAKYKEHVQRLASAASAPAPAPETTFKVNVRQVLVPVVVTDKDGHHVTGLTAADFKVFEDGVEQRISGFSVETEGVPGSASKTAPAAESGPVMASAAPAPVRPPVRRTYLVCIDSLHAEFSNLVHMREALKKLFASEPAGDARYVVIAVGRGTEMVQEATTDPAVVLQAIEQKRFQKLYLSSSKSSLQAEMARYRQDLGQIRAACDSHEPDCQRKTSLPAAAAAIAEEERQYNIAFLTNFGSLVEQMSHGTERRTIVLISDGFGLVPGKEAFELLVAFFPEFRTYSLRTVDRMPEMTPILRLAANSNIPIYTVDSRGLYTQEFYSAQNTSTGPPQLMPAIQSAMDDSARDAGGTLTEIAAATGGTAFQNSNDILQGLERAFADGRSYYMLAYVPSNANPDGKFRAIQVRVRDKKVVVSAKRGYWPQEANP